MSADVIGGLLGSRVQGQRRGRRRPRRRPTGGRIEEAVSADLAERDGTARTTDACGDALSVLVASPAAVSYRHLTLPSPRPTCILGVCRAFNLQ
ncbi:hypothetical protein CLM82_24910, partial [Streptomyces albidoflavus]